MEKDEKPYESESLEMNSFEIVVKEDARSIKSECSEGSATELPSQDNQSSGSLDSGVPLSAAETFLAKRVRDMKLENDELKKAINSLHETLQLCEKDLNTWKHQQKENHRDLLTKHGQAKATVMKLQSENASLKHQLENKHSDLGEITDARKHKIPSVAMESLKNKSPERKSVDNVLETNLACLQELVQKMVSSFEDDHEKLCGPEATFLQELTKICEELGKTSLLVNTSNGNASLQEELQSVKANYIRLDEQLKEEKLKQLQLEQQNKELQHLIDINSTSLSGKDSTGFNHNGQRMGIEELQGEVQLLEKGVREMEKVRAGFVSHGSETTEGSYTSAQDFEGFKREEELMRALKNAIEKREGDKLIMDKRETELLKRLEGALEAKSKLEKENGTLKEENLSIREQLEDIIANKKLETHKEDDGRDKRETELLNKLNDAQAEKEKLEKELGALKEDNFSIREQLEDVAAKKILETHKDDKENLRLMEGLVAKQSVQEHEQRVLNQLLEQKDQQIETMKSQVCHFYQELQEREKESTEWGVQKLEMQKRLMEMGSRCQDTESALIETRKELASLYSQNEKLLANNKINHEESNAEIADYKTKIDNLTAQLLSAEEMLENKEQDYRKLQREHASAASEMETLPLLKQQIEVFQTDFATEQQTRQKREEDCKRLREEVDKLRAENEKLIEEINAQSGSKMAELQRRHGLAAAANNSEQSPNPWNGFYDRFLAPRGPPGRNAPAQPADSDPDRQVSGGRCPKCDRMFPDLDALQIHVVECLESDSRSSAATKVCPKCQGSFPELDTLQIHLMECLDS